MRIRSRIGADREDGQDGTINVRAGQSDAARRYYRYRRGHGAGTQYRDDLEGVPLRMFGVSPITLFDVSAYPTRIAAEIKDWDASPWMDKKEIRRMDRFVQFAVARRRWRWRTAA